MDPYHNLDQNYSQGAQHNQSSSPSNLSQHPSSQYENQYPPSQYPPSQYPNPPQYPHSHYSQPPNPSGGANVPYYGYFGSQIASSQFPPQFPHFPPQFSQFPPQTQDPPPQQNQTSRKRGKGKEKAQQKEGGTKTRGENYSTEEDRKLCEAWVQISEDPIVSNNQKDEVHFGRVEERFRSSMGGSSRTRDSISGRWLFIQRETRKFHKAYNDISMLPQSGRTAQELVLEALDHFHEIEGHHFAFDHCFKILKDVAKWNENLTTKTKPKRSSYERVQNIVGGVESGSSTPTTPSTPIDVDVNFGDLLGKTPYVRPEGGKKAKEKKKKGGEMANSLSGFYENFDARLAKQDEDRRKDIAIREREMALQEQKFARDIVKEDNQIMAMDMSHLEEHQKTYWRQRQFEIIAKRNSRNINFENVED